MSAEQIQALLPLFVAYLETYRACFPRRDTFRHLLTYCRGLLCLLKRKSVEPIALAGGTAVRTLQAFLAQSQWDHWRMRDLLQARIAARPAGDDGLGAIGVIDETSDDKKGTKTPGVQRQWLGRLGKTDNGIVTVHLAYVWGKFKSLLDADLFLPESWGQDRERCREAGIPDDLGYRPKTEIALEQVRRAIAHGVKFTWLTFDEGYGKAVQFLFGLEQLGQFYVGEVPKIFRCATRGRSTCTVYNLFRYSPFFRRQRWRVFHLERQTLGPQTWRIKSILVRLALEDGSFTALRYWLIVGWQQQTGEYKYWIAQAPPGTRLEVLVKVAFTRWNVEHSFRVAKQEIGFMDFEGRTYNGLIRHMLLCCLVMLFLAEQTAAQAAFSP